MNYGSIGFFGPGSGKKQVSAKKPGFNFGKKQRPGFGGGLFGPGFGGGFGKSFGKNFGGGLFDSGFWGGLLGPGFGGGSGGGLFGPGFGKGLGEGLFTPAFGEFLGSLLGGLFGIKPNKNRARYNARRIPGRNRRY